MAFRNIPPNGFPAIPDIEDLEGVEKDVATLKTTTAGLAEDVGDLEEQKANQITIALSFNPETEYEVGDLVYYNGLTYRCTNAHTGEWDADDFAGTTIANELASLKSGLTNLVKTEIITTTTDADGDGQFALPAGGTYLVGTKPLRDADYYNAWWGIILAASNSSNYAFKAVSDNLTVLANQPVMIRIYYV